MQSCTVWRTTFYPTGTYKMMVSLFTLMVMFLKCESDCQFKLKLHYSVRSWAVAASVCNICPCVDKRSMESDWIEAHKPADENGCSSYVECIYEDLLTYSIPDQFRVAIFRVAKDPIDNFKYHTDLQCARFHGIKVAHEFMTSSLDEHWFSFVRMPRLIQNF